MKHVKVLTLIVVTFFIASCSTSTLIGIDYKKGQLLKIEDTDKTVKKPVGYDIELENNQLRVYESHDDYSTTIKTYEKIRVECKSEYNLFPLSQGLIDFVCFGKLNPQVNYITDIGNKVYLNETKTNEVIVDEQLKFSRNGRELVENGEISINESDNKFSASISINNGVGYFYIDDYYDKIIYHENIQVVFKYKDSELRKYFTNDEIVASAKSRLNHHANKAINENNVKEYVLAYYISDDIDYIYQAKKTATKDELPRLETLITQYNEQAEKSEFEEATAQGKLDKFIIKYPDSKHLPYLAKLVYKQTKSTSFTVNYLSKIDDFKNKLNDHENKIYSNIEELIEAGYAPQLAFDAVDFYVNNYKNKYIERPHLNVLINNAENIQSKKDIKNILQLIYPYQLSLAEHFKFIRNNCVSVEYYDVSKNPYDYTTDACFIGLIKTTQILSIFEAIIGFQKNNGSFNVTESYGHISSNSAPIKNGEFLALFKQTGVYKYTNVINSQMIVPDILLLKVL